MEEKMNGKPFQVKPSGVASPFRRGGDFLFLAGQVPIDEETGKRMGESIAEQTQLVMEKIKKILAMENASLDDIVKATVFITDMKDYEGLNKVYLEHFTSAPPARSCIIVSKLSVDAKVEIEAIAYSPEK